MLKLDALHAGYPHRPVLLGIDLEVADGEALALLGRNGVGKTTLLKTIIGALKPTSGSIHLGDVEISHWPPHRRAKSGVAYVPQGREVFVGLSVAENLRVAAEAIFGRGWRQHVERTLDEFQQLAAKRNLPAGSLSGGQQQILALARALISQPRILLLDEPSEGIQPSILDRIVELIAQARSQRSLAVLIAEQNLGFAARIAPQSALLERGRVAERLPIAEVESSAELQRRYLAV